MLGTRDGSDGLVVDPEPFLSGWMADFYSTGTDDLGGWTAGDEEASGAGRTPTNGLRLLAGGLANCDRVPVGLPDGDGWEDTVRIAPRPLPGISGVAGPELAAALSGMEMSQLSPAQLVEVMTGAERLARWAQSVQLTAVGAFAEYAVITDEDGRDDPLAGLPGSTGRVEIGFGTQREIETFCADGIGAALGVSFTAGQQLIDAACFAAAVPGVRTALEAGGLDLARVKVLARELALVGYTTADEQDFVDAQVAGHDGLTPKKLEAKVREAVMTRSPEQARQVRRREQTTRGVWLSRQPAGMASLSLRLRADEAQLAYQALNAAAWHHHDQALAESGRDCEDGEYRSFDNFRADAFMIEMRDLQLRYLQPNPTPTGGAGLGSENGASENGKGENGKGESGKGESGKGESGKGENGKGENVGTSEAGSEEAGTNRTEARQPGSAAGYSNEDAPAAATETGSAAPASARGGDCEPRADEMAAQTTDTATTDTATTDTGTAGSRATGASDPPRSKRAARMMDPARVMLHLYMDAATLTGQSHRPAHLLGYGPIDPDLARELATDATVVRLLTDPFTGQVQAIDLPAYRVPKILRWAVQARDRGCVFPGCDIPAYDTQLDHINPHPFARKLRKAFATGTTTFTNLQNLCLRHHYLKTHGGWTVQTTRGSQLEWISPTGHTYRRNPEWGPPAGFWNDHQSDRPIDDPPGAAPPRPQPEALDCPF